MNKLILALFFLSGACGLVYEIVWTRMLSHVFGTTVYAVSTVLAAYMAGLALGSYVFGKIADKHGRPMKIYGILEAGIGITALLVPVSFNALKNIYVALHSINNDFVFSALRFITSFLVLMIPTTLMGGTLPILSRYFVKKADRVGLNIGRVYSVNTFGALAGCLITGFILIENLGINNAIILAAAINIIIAFIVLNIKTEAEVPAIESAELEQPFAGKHPSRNANLAIIVFAVSGFCALAYEVLWSRMLVYSLISLTYSFTLMLSTILFGIALGSYIFSKIADRNKHLLTTLGLIEAIIGVIVILGIIGFGSVNEFCGNTGKTWPSWIITRFIACSLIMLLPAILMGGTFPLVGKIYIRSTKKAGKSTANIYSLNTVGGIIGSLAAGFMMIPLFGIQQSIFIFSLLNILAGFIVIIFDDSTGWKFKVTATSAISTLCAALFLIIPFNKPIVLYSRSVYEAGNKAKVLFYKEDVTATVSVIELKGDRLLNIDGFNAAGVKNYEYMRILGHLPLLLCADPKDVLVICFGSGTTSGAVSKHNLDHIDCVEISPAVIQAAPFYAEVNNNVLADKKFNVIIDDGRNYLLYTKKKYDVITMEPMHPSLSGVVNFYSKEFYELCKSRLNPGGVICQWAPMHILSVNDYKMMVRTFQEVFPHTSFWLAKTEGIMIGTQDKLKLDFQLLQKKISAGEVRQDLDRVQCGNIYAIFDSFIMGEEKLRKYSEKSRLLTDAHPYIEFSGPRNLLLKARETWGPNNQALVNNMENILPFVSNIPAGAYAAVQANLSRNYLLSKCIFQAKIYANETDTVKLINELGKLFLLNPHDERIKTFLPNDNNQLKYFYFNIGERFRSEGEYNGAVLAFNKVLAIDSLYARAYNGLGIVYSAMKKYELSEKKFRKSLEIEPNVAIVHTNLGIVYFDRGSLDKAMSEFNKAVKIDYQYAKAHYYLVKTYQLRGMFQKAMEELTVLLDINPAFEGAQKLYKELAIRNNK